MSKAVATVALSADFVAAYGEPVENAVVYAVAGGGFAFELTGGHANTGPLGDVEGVPFATVAAALAVALDPASEAGELSGDLA